MPALTNKPKFSKETWATPKALFRRLDEEFHFDLDICANQDNACCTRYVDEESDAFSIQNWFEIGQRIYMNPPYGRGKIDRWVQYACKQVARDFISPPKRLEYPSIIAVLVPVDVSTKWWSTLVKTAIEVRLIGPGRLKFDDGGGSPPFSSAVAILGNFTSYLLSRSYFPARLKGGTIYMWDWKTPLDPAEIWCKETATFG